MTNIAGYESVKKTLRVSDNGEIVARIETERAIVHGNRELIRLYEEKTKKVIPARRHNKVCFVY